MQSHASGWKKQYKNTKIFKIYHTSDPSKFYIGHTTSTLGRQIHEHFKKIEGKRKDISKLLEYKKAIESAEINGKWKCDEIIQLHAENYKEVADVLKNAILDSKAILN